MWVIYHPRSSWLYQSPHCTKARAVPRLTGSFVPILKFPCRRPGLSAPGPHEPPYKLRGHCMPSVQEAGLPWLWVWQGTLDTLQFNIQHYEERRRKCLRSCLRIWEISFITHSKTSCTLSFSFSPSQAWQLLLCFCPHAASSKFSLNRLSLPHTILSPCTFHIAP